MTTEIEPKHLERVAALLSELGSNTLTADAPTMLAAYQAILTKELLAKMTILVPRMISSHQMEEWETKAAQTLIDAAPIRKGEAYGWLSMSDAPKDRRIMVVCDEHINGYAPVVAVWSNDDQAWFVALWFVPNDQSKLAHMILDDDGNGCKISPTRWHPLPEPPK